MQPNSNSASLGRNSLSIRRLCLTGALTAATFVLTAFLHIPVHNGYVHVGDAVLYLTACLLPTPYAVFTGAAGAALADVLTGFAVYALGSAIIKAATALCFSSRGETFLNRRNLVGLLPAAVLCIGGYYLYEVLLSANFVAPLAALPDNFVQWLCSTILFVPVAAALDRFGLKRRLGVSGGKSR